MTSTSCRLTFAIFNLLVTRVTVFVLKNKILNYCGRQEFQIHRGISRIDLVWLKNDLKFHVVIDLYKLCYIFTIPNVF